MDNLMELKLNTPVEKMVEHLVLTFNNEELKQNVTTMLTRYENTVYDDSSIGEAKSDKAKLNAFATALNSERISIGKVWDAPFFKFKSQVDEIIDLVKTASKKIDNVVIGYEERKKSTKLEEIKTYFDSVIGDLKEFVSFEKIYNSKWLNVAETKKKIQGEIDEKLSKIKNEIITIEALKSDFEADIKVFYFRELDLSRALMENERLKQERERVAATVKKVEQQPEIKQVVAEPTKEEALYEIKFEVIGSASQLAALKTFLVTNKIEYRKLED